MARRTAVNRGIGVRVPAEELWHRGGMATHAPAKRIYTGSIPVDASSQTGVEDSGEPAANTLGVRSANAQGNIRKGTRNIERVKCPTGFASVPLRGTTGKYPR